MGDAAVAEGRGRGQGTSSHGHSSHSHGESRAHSNGTHTPKKKESFISKLLGIFKGKKKPEAKPLRHEETPRPEVREREREPRAERPRREDRPPKADPTPQEITTPKLYVGNLAYEAAESDLFDLFSKIGAVKNVEVAMDRRTSRSKGFGFVEMESLDTAKQAAEKLNRTDFMGRRSWSAAPSSTSVRSAARARKARCADRKRDGQRHRRVDDLSSEIRIKGGLPCGPPFFLRP